MINRIDFGSMEHPVESSGKVINAGFIPIVMEMKPAQVPLILISNAMHQVGPRN
ncbi:hypothetical protein OQI89_07900 [Lentilactobacillus diolivorans]|uniref:hypothetical protein n=1 Tax=Lentilactobacillus diolivorans TaxID=179838 RepID=UPI002468F836|nr:hypothetical protein [Lentilactobacillus diolivorans]MDH5105769.1 hypothetical protein [Lentilactobacillus diolivorans]